jgi:shikimate kinase
VWLRGPVSELVERARRAGLRPMLDGRSLDEIEALYRQREPHYARAHVIVDTEGRGPDAVVAHILAALRARDVSAV